MDYKTNKYMRLVFTFLALMIFLNGYSQTQLELNEKANDAFFKADNELNAVYKKVITENKEDTIFIKNLRISQRIWITFRDAEVNVKFPEREPGYYGSMLPMCISLYLEQLTKERTETLKKYLGNNGDGCN